MSKRSHIESTGGIPDTAGPVSKRTRPAQDGNSDAQSQNSAGKINNTALPQIPPLAIVTKWTAVTLSRSRPPLPAVLDEALKTAALTHSGMRKNPLDASYERLEWIGDSYLYTIASSLVFQTFPDLDPGKCSQLRERLIRNATLCHYTRHYGLDKIAIFPEEFALQGRIGGTSASDKQRQKALGDIFESYVGAVILSDPENGVQRAADWLKALWGPELENDIRREEAKKPQTSLIGPKTELERAIVSPGVKIQYKDLPNYRKDKTTNLQLFTVGCFLTGWGETDKQLGFGSALGKKEAGAKAAQMALENRKLIQVYIDKKKAHLEARAAAQAVAEAKAAAETSGDLPGN